jgi:PPOX class probable F420-dependent enzyme
MKVMSREEALAFLAYGTRTDKLATVRPDGRPHVAPIWFVVEGESLVFNTWHTSVKARNLRHSPRAALAVDYQEPPYGHVLVEGIVELGDDLAEVRRVATAIGGRYMGADRAEEFGARNGVEGELAVRLNIDRIIGRDDMAGY